MKLLLFTRKLYIRFRISDVKTFAQIGSNVIGLKLDGSFGVPLVYKHAEIFVEVTGITFLVQQ